MIEFEAKHRATAFLSTSENVHISQAIDRITACTLRSPQSTPEYDTSAMDGFALNSELTEQASAESPVIFEIKGLMSAGDKPILISGRPGVGVYPCVEIMTGARFPNVIDTNSFDCCVPLEDTVPFTDSDSKRRYIKVSKAFRFGQHRRIAGEDFNKGDVIIQKGASMRPHHIMALSAVGITEIAVLKRPRIGIFSTGSELTSPVASRPDLHRIRDVNGPYITATLKDWKVDVDFLGLLEDDDKAMAERIKHHLEKNTYDMIISTGAVSTGRYDLIPTALGHLPARVIFHKIDIKPGHPVLFALVPTTPRADDHTFAESQPADIAYFGLPGNPVASAACLEFLVLPYLKALQSQELKGPLKATLRGSAMSDNDCRAATTANAGDLIATFLTNKDVFRPGFLYHTADNQMEARLIEDHSPGKVKPFNDANCWVHISQAVTKLMDGDLVECFPTN